jgi:predicted kinase
MNKPQCLLTIGISSSGKSTWAEQFVKDNPNWVNINRDDVRFALFNNGERDWTKYKFNKNSEKRVTEVCDQMIADAVIEDKNIIISDTNLNPKTRKRLEDKLHDYGYEIAHKEFPITFEEAIKRDAQRQGGVGENVLWKQYMQWLDYIGKQKYIPDTNLPKAIIVDVDGTLAKHTHRSPFEWDKVSTDDPIEHVVDLVKAIQDNYYIICMSGRDEICRKDTEAWLLHHGIIFDELFMRKQGDMRKDTIVKEELFWEHVANKYFIQYCIDDRNSVIRMWYGLGIPVVCVGNIQEEF